MELNSPLDNVEAALAENQKIQTKLEEENLEKEKNRNIHIKEGRGHCLPGGLISLRK